MNDRRRVVEPSVAHQDQLTDSGPMVLFPRIAKQVVRRSTDELLGMPLRLLIALSYLRDHGGAQQQELGRALSMDASNVVLVLNELEGLGYISRSRDPDDRRRHRVTITTAGVHAARRAERAQEEIEEQLLGGLDAEERTTLVRLLNRVIQGVEPAVERSGATTVGG
jgi:DNA-binding MarR family transcriptional regulator